MPKTGGTHQTEPDEEGKVVRIPRDWFGPPDELVPFGPRAAQTDQERRERGRNGTLAAPLDPNSFWDESSSAIQDVVQAPVAGARRTMADAGAIGGLGRSRACVANAYDVVRDRVGVREAVAGVVIALIVGLGAVGWLAGGSLHPPAVAGIAAVSGEGASQMLRWLESSDARRVPERSSLTANRKRRTEPSTRHSQAIEVAYHSNQAPSIPSPPTGRLNSVPSAGAQTAHGGPGSKATEASAGASSQSSTSAFGASSALGPMSSPDG